MNPVKTTLQRTFSIHFVLVAILPADNAQTSV